MKSREASTHEYAAEAEYVAQACSTDCQLAMSQPATLRKVVPGRLHSPKRALNTMGTIQWTLQYDQQYTLTVPNFAIRNAIRRMATHQGYVVQPKPALHCVSKSYKARYFDRQSARGRPPRTHQIG